MAKLHDLPTQPIIDRVGVVLGMTILYIEKCVFQLKGVLAHWYRPHQVLLDLGVQYLMVGKETMDGSKHGNVCQKIEGFPIIKNL
jgi:hypothetical protein